MPGRCRFRDQTATRLPFTMSGGGASATSRRLRRGMSVRLDNSSGTNTWTGTITLLGAGGNGGDPTLNQIGASGGTLTVSGAIVDTTSTAASLAKSGSGDVVYTGASPNTYQGLTRVFGGRLIIEKDGALGGMFRTRPARAGNTFMLAGSQASIRVSASAQRNERIQLRGAGMDPHTDGAAGRRNDRADRQPRRDEYL